jgi:hypothetical protein
VGGTRTSRTGLLSAAALLLAAGGLVAYVVGEQAAREAPQQPAAAPGARRATDAPAARPDPTLSTSFAPWRTDPAAGATPSDGVSSPSAAEDPAEADAASRLMRSMARLVSDLEYNSNRGLKEPPQQAVAPFPEPWRPPAEAAGQPDPVIDQVTPLRATTRGGTKVVLRGRHLRAPQVMFGASPASVVSATDREVTVLAPPSPAGPVTIAVTNDDGTYALVGTAFTFAD